MDERSGEESPSSFIVMDSMNSHGAVTVQCPDSRATYHVVEYADSETRERMASLTEGAQVRMCVERAGARANVWRATELVAGTANPEAVRV
jgi:hypothetical protein